MSIYCKITLIDHLGDREIRKVTSPKRTLYVVVKREGTKEIPEGAYDTLAQARDKAQIKRVAVVANPTPPKSSYPQYTGGRAK